MPSRDVPSAAPGAGDAPGRRFSYWLADTLRYEREENDIPRTTVAAVLDVDDQTLRRFELGEGKGYGQDVDRYVAGYAYMLGLDDPRELWQRALDRWKAKGAPPDFMDDLPGARFVRPVRDRRLQREAARGAEQEKPNGSRRKRGAG